MKIATFNVNGVNGRLPLVIDWLKRERPAIACLQELKAAQERFPAGELQAIGYQAVWHGQKSWNGVAILSRNLPVRERRRGLPGDREDRHSRYIEAEVGDLIIASLYLPNGNPSPGPKFDYKLKWFVRLILHARSLLRENRPVILAGDFNVMPTDIDVYAPDSWREDALFRPEVREAFDLMIEDGWTDALRVIFPTERVYTFWKYWRGSFERDAGLRIDHLLLSPDLKRRLKGAGVDRVTRGMDHPSDHAPVWIEIATPPASKREVRSKLSVLRAKIPPRSKK
jgi:exodeoxyribonuclease-3